MGDRVTTGFGPKGPPSGKIYSFMRYVLWGFFIIYVLYKAR
jgi:hypothetical protein